MHLLIVSSQVLPSHVFQNALVRQNIRSLVCLPSSLSSEWIPQSDAVFFPHALSEEEWRSLLPFLFNVSPRLPLLLASANRFIFQNPLFKSFLKQSIFIDESLGLDEFPILAKDLIEKSSLKEQGRQVQIGPYILDRCQRSVIGPDARTMLTRKEFFLLELLIQNSGRVTTREHIIDRVWDKREYVAPNTIEVYVSRLRRKFNQSALNSWIKTIPCLGYQFSIPVSVEALGYELESDVHAPRVQAQRPALVPAL